MFIEQSLYEEIIKIFPRTCVDIMVIDEQGRVLLMFRNNEPARGQWWFPGGRIYFGETRLQAAQRKIKEECGLDVTELVEISTFDLFFSSDQMTCHDVTILFKMKVFSYSEIKTDNQSKEYGWFKPEACRDLKLHSYILTSIEKTLKNMH